ncbi:MAG TPA: peptidylprolyl isomerase [Terriglobales bacterium]|nr:peptidylprolyl isomerase [Terriglobales bacterium]
MLFRICGLMLLSAMGWAQTNSSATPPHKSSASAATSSHHANMQSSTASKDVSEAAKSNSDPAVITIQGLCNKPSATKTAKPAAAPCETTISRSEFEAVVNAIQPEMPESARKQFASRYAMGMVLAHDAHEQGLDRGPAFQEMMKLMRVQVMAQELAKNFRKQAMQISDADVKAYYEKNSDKYQEADFERIYIPKTKQAAPKPDEKPADVAKERADSETEMKAKADALHASAVAGGDFSKLQSDAFETAGMKVESPSTKLTKVRAANFPPDQRSIFELKPGAVSNVIPSQSGFFIYKLDSKTAVPLDQASQEIRSTLENERFQEKMEAVQKSVQLSYDDNYFKAAPPVTHTMPNQPQAPSNTRMANPK